VTDSAGAVGQRVDLLVMSAPLEGSMRNRVPVSTPHMTPYIMSNGRTRVLTRQIENHCETVPDQGIFSRVAMRDHDSKLI
jgi:hypothetical protein